MKSLFAAVQFFIVVFLFLAGSACLGFHYMYSARQKCAEWITCPETNFSLLGFIILALALVLTLSFFYMQKGVFLRLQMSGKEFFVAEELLKKMIEEFWKKKFPSNSPPQEVMITNQKIEIVSQEMDIDLEKVEIQLAAFLSKQLGYKKEFFITFRSNS